MKGPTRLAELVKRYILHHVQTFVWKSAPKSHGVLLLFLGDLLCKCSLDNGEPHLCSHQFVRRAKYVRRLIGHCTRFVHLYAPVE